MDFQSGVRVNGLLAEGGAGTVHTADLLDDRLKAKHHIKKVAIKLVKGKFLLDISISYQLSLLF